MWIECADEQPTGKVQIIDGDTYFKGMCVQRTNKNLCVAYFDEDDVQWHDAYGYPMDDVVRWCDCIPETPD